MIDLRLGDCLHVLRTMPDSSVDAVVTDPPYGLAFMGKRWDYDVPSVEVWQECLRVLKPGGHLLAFAGTRTQHRMCVRIEDAGFEIRDMITWVFATGFPKSLDVGNKLEDWQGWGTALKPALEPITVARKPLDGIIVDNVSTHGTGALNIDGCRVGNETDSGRWPANLIHDGSDEVVGLFPKTGPSKTRPPTGKDDRGVPGFVMRRIDTKTRGHNDNGGSAARFFYCSKASKRDRDEGLDAFPIKTAGQKTDREDGSAGITAYAGSRGPTRNSHPTVKPTDLMRYLCRLVTPPKGVVLDPFMGSGSTGKAAVLEGFQFIGIEREPQYLEIAKARIDAVQPDEESGQLSLI